MPEPLQLIDVPQVDMSHPDTRVMVGGAWLTVEQYGSVLAHIAALVDAPPALQTPPPPPPPAAEPVTAEMTADEVARILEAKRGRIES